MKYFYSLSDVLKQPFEPVEPRGSVKTKHVDLSDDRPIPRNVYYNNFKITGSKIIFVVHNFTGPANGIFAFKF
jgi:hypothetical protein